MVHTLGMQEAFGYVLFTAVGVGVLTALLSLFVRNKAYDDIGKGGFFKEDDKGFRRPEPGSALDLAERDEEIRQMLTARNARHTASGHGEIVDIEAELQRLIAPQIDPALREEIRELVVAKNARRMRKGLEPLDIDEEVERQVRAFEGGGA